MDEIKNKFKKVALKIHPDKNKNLDANHKMQQLNQALLTLNDKKLKHDYDKQLFIYALKNGDHKVVNFFINNPTKLPFTLSSNEINNNMLLHYACLLGSLSVVQLLIKVGVNIDQFDIKGNTALNYACLSGSLSVVQLLINKGCNINLKNSNGFNSLDFAQNINTNKEITNLLVTKLLAEKTLAKAIRAQEEISENQQILININQRLKNIEKHIIKIEKDIAFLQRQKINIFLNFIIKIFSCGCINQNQNVNIELLLKKNELQDLLAKRVVVTEQKQSFQKKITKLSIKIKKINAINVQNNSVASKQKLNSHQF